MSNLNVNHQLSTLYELQEIDIQIKKLDDQRKALPENIRRLNAEFEKEKRFLEAKKNELKDMQVELRSKNGLLVQQEEQIKKYSSQQESAKNKKEYNAFQRQINNLQKKNAVLEDEILELMFSIDAATDKLPRYEEDYDEKVAVCEKEKADLLSTEKALKSQIAELNKGREKYLDKIDSWLMERYDEWRISRGRFLLAPVNGNVCGGCNLTIPPQTINEIRKKQEIIFCGSCGRILYMPEE